MKLDFTGLSYDPKWYDFDTGELVDNPGSQPSLKIRPYPRELRKIVLRDGGVLVEGNESRNVFVYCLVDMANFEDSNGRQLQCTEAIKAEIYKYDLAGIPLFVMGKSNQFQNTKESSEKN